MPELEFEIADHPGDDFGSPADFAPLLVTDPVVLAAARAIESQLGCEVIDGGHECLRCTDGAPCGTVYHCQAHGTEAEHEVAPGSPCHLAYSLAIEALSAAGRVAATARGPLARLIEQHIDGLRAERRLYPDTYAAALADDIIAAGWAPTQETHDA